MNPNVQELIQQIETHDHLNPSLCKKLLLDSKLTTQDLMPWADFEHPAEDSYGRKLVYNGGFFELMVMSWRDGDMAAIHDHGYTQWGAVKLFGAAEHAIFKVQSDVLTTSERRVFAAGDVVAVGHDLIHQMGNVGQDNFLSLHLYGCYERDCDITADARLYDLFEEKILITSGGVFFDLPEDAIDERRSAPAADFPTTLRDRVEHLKRMLNASNALETGRLSDPKSTGLTQWLFDETTWQGAQEELAERLDDTSLASERYLEILHQELRATAELQMALVEADLATGPLAKASQELAKLVDAPQDTAEFGAEYLGLLGETFAIDFPLLVAA